MESKILTKEIDFIIANDKTIATYLSEDQKSIEINVKDYIDTVSGFEELDITCVPIQCKNFYIEVEVNASLNFKLVSKRFKKFICSNIKAAARVLNVFVWNDSYQEYEPYPISYYEEKELNQYLIQHIHLQ